MKVLAVLVSPLGGVLFIFLAFLLWSAIFANNFSGVNPFVIPVIFISYVVGLIFQIAVVETIMLNKYFQFSLERYCWLGLIFSLCFSTIALIYLGMENLGWIFFYFPFYTIGNILTYNELYFKQLKD